MGLGRFSRTLVRKAGQAILHVGRVADLAGFAVAHHVDTELRLPPDNISDGMGDRLVEFRKVQRGTVFALL